MVRHLEHLVEMGTQSAELGLELVDTVPVSHVLGEMVQAVNPVVQSPCRKREEDWNEGHGPKRHAIDVEHGPVDVDGSEVAVSEDSRRHADREADQKRASEQEPLPDVVQSRYRGEGYRVCPMVARN